MSFDQSNIVRDRPLDFYVGGGGDKKDAQTPNICIILHSLIKKGPIW